MRRLLGFLAAGAAVAAALWAGKLYQAERLISGDLSESSLRSALEWNPHSDKGHFLLGLLLRDAAEGQDLPGSIAAFRRAAEINPLNWKYHQELARTCELAEEAEAAAEAFGEAVRRNPNSPEIRWEKANFLLRRGETAAAAAELKSALELDASGLEGAAMLLAGAGMSFEEIAESMVANRRDDLLRYLNFFLARTAGDPERALNAATSLWRRAMQAEGKETMRLEQSHYYVGFLLDQGKGRQAADAWEAALRLANLPREAERFRQGLITDGGFERKSSGGGLDWLIYHGHPEVAYTFDQERRYRGLASLRMNFAGRSNLDFWGPEVRVPLGEGSYTLSYVARSQGVTSDQKVYLAVYGHPGNELIAAGDGMRGTEDWRLVSVDFALEQPAVVKVVVRRQPSRKLDNRFGGVLWLDEVAIRRRR